MGESSSAVISTHQCSACNDDSSINLLCCGKCESRIHANCMYSKLLSLLPNKNRPKNKTVPSYFIALFSYNLVFSLCDKCKQSRLDTPNISVSSMSTSNIITKRDASTQKASLGDIDILIEKAKSLAAELTRGIGVLNGTRLTSSDQQPTYSSILKKSFKSKVADNDNHCEQVVVIEHIDKANRNNKYIYELFSVLKLDTNTIKHVDLKSQYATIILSSPFIRDSLLSARPSLSKTKFSKLYIRPFLTESVVKTGKLFHHVLKAGLLKDYKNVLNHRTLKYELRKFSLVDDRYRIDWKSDSFEPDSGTLKLWTDSRIDFLKSTNGKDA